MALPKNKKVSEYNQEELNEYCQILFDKSGKPATRGPCKNWSGGVSNGLSSPKTSKQALEFLDSLLADERFQMLTVSQGAIGETITTYKNPLSGKVKNANDLKEAVLKFDTIYHDVDKEREKAWELTDTEARQAHISNIHKMNNENYDNEKATLKKLDQFDKEYSGYGNNPLLYKFKSPIKVRVDTKNFEDLTEVEGRIRLYNNNYYWQPKGMSNRLLPVPEGFVRNLESVSSTSAERKRVDNYDKVLKLKDPNLWVEGIDETAYSTKPIRSITSLIPKEVQEKLAEAIANKKDYSSGRHRTSYGGKKEYSVEVKFDENGQGRAWFSAEKRGLGHGDYYLLINSTTAVFCETD